ncbi:5-formyltetrahydrofolate cyclo-ligase [Candidatus Vondammii sp. HM_W22]|uniref:5-formyltetrahydrofolate cyclo-ligase n=1 Tax=Candidatus Vondammii sp. HM_W22 TaxID=2687299 RepID=UPI001F13A926|nr:5-formyltetrahydrofolate cyclo-ligase [Candidatus Vondammii sp. HM_W22]
MQTPAEIRKQKRLLRRQLTDYEKKSHSEAVAKHFICSSLFLRCKRIALYLATDGELNPEPLLQRARTNGKIIYLPVLRPGTSNSLLFSEFHPRERLIKNRFGIPEPDIRKHKPTPVWGLDIVLLPLVAFDNSGSRQGMGGSYYDRTLSYLKQRNHWRKPTLIGLAHECQRVSCLERRQWDIPLHGIITEDGLQRFSSNIT